MKIKEISELLEYNPLTGKVLNKSTGNFLSLLDEGWTSFKNHITGKQVKIKMNKLCYSLGTKEEVQKTQKIIHKNLDDTDFRLNNLTCLDADDYKIYKEALKNLQGGIKVVPHPNMVGEYRISWFSDSIKKTKVIKDIVVVKRFETRLKLKYSKILSRYTVSD